MAPRSPSTTSSPQVFGPTGSPAGDGTRIPATSTCTRRDVLPAGHSYPPVTLKVDVSCNAGARVTNTATVAGGGDTTTHTATDTTTIEHHEHHEHHGHDGDGHDGHDGRHDHCDRHDH